MKWYPSLVSVPFMAYKNKKNGGAESGSFAFAGGGLPASLVGITLALTLLGSAHNWGTCQNAASMGVIAAWFGIACVIMMVVITQITGPWIRRTGAKTIGDFLNKVFGKVPGTMISCVNAALSIAMVCLEVETIAITLSFLTGWSYMISAIVGGILAMLYVLLAGMKEIAWLNLLNAILMYAALIVVFICLCFKLPGGWDQVEATMTASADTSWMTSIFGNKALIIGFAIPSALGATMFHGMAQTGYQPVATAKNNHEVKNPSGLQAQSTVYSVSSRPHRCSCFLYPGIQKRRFHDDDTGHAAGSAAEAGHRITGCRIFGCRPFFLRCYGTGTGYPDFT